MIDARLNTFSLRPFDVYLPPRVSSDIAMESTTASLTWEKGSEAKVRLKTALKSETPNSSSTERAG